MDDRLWITAASRPSSYRRTLPIYRFTRAVAAGHHRSMLRRRSDGGSSRAEELDDLHERGVISAEERAEARAKILGG